MRIVLDLQGAQGESRFRGIGRYTLALAQAIARQRGDHEVVLALSDLYPDTIEPIRGMFDGCISQDRIRVWQAPGPVRSQDPANDWRRAATRRIREAFIASLEPDIVHVSDIFGGYVDDVVASIGSFGLSFLTTVSIYDLIPLLNPDEYFGRDPRYERHYMNAVADAKRADGWLAISDSSAREARGRLGIDADRVVNISAACDTRFTRVALSQATEDRLRERCGLPRPFVMYSGGSEPTKNLDRLVRAYAQLPTSLREARQLVMVGRMAPSHVADLNATAHAAGLRTDDLRFTGYVEDDDLVLLYNLCELFVQPSTHEGFGLPALEAMSSGAAVIGANATSLPEVIGWGDALFDPFDLSSISAKMAHALTDSAFRSELIRRGAVQVQKFSWDESAKTALAAFEQLVAGRTPFTTQGSPASATAVTRLVREVRATPGKPSSQDLIKAARAIAQNHPEMSEPRLLVDVSALIHVDLRSGIQRVVRSMLTSLPMHLPGRCIEAVYATSGRPGYRHARRSDGEDGISLLEATNEVVEPRTGDIFLGLDLEPRVVPAQAAFYSELRRLGIPVYFVVYDLLPVLMPDRFPADAKAGHERWLGVVSAADGALCISRAVAQELRTWVQANGSPRYRPLRVAWFHLGSDIEHSKPTSALPSGSSETVRELAARSTFTLVGTIEPRKGHAQTLDAFELLWGAHVNANLVFVGTRGWQVDALIERIHRHAELGRRLFWMDGVSDEYLDEIYRASTCLIIPSEGEGFGLPLIEAARHGTPIIARDIPAFREVAGDHAMYFRGRDPQSLADAVRDWLTLQGQGQHPRPHGMNPLTWDQSAAQVAEFLFGQGRDLEAASTTGPA